MLSMLQMINQVFIASEIVFFNIIGLFGNINFIILTVSRTNLRSKSTILQSVLCFSHIICLLSELLQAILIILGIELHRSECFMVLTPYIFFICIQAVMILMLVIDLYVIIYAPTFYRSVSTWKYLASMLIVPVAFSTATVIWGYCMKDQDDGIVIFCNPPMALHPLVSRFWTLSNVVVNSMTLVLFIILLIIFHYRGKAQKSDTRRIMKRLKISILFFISTWYIGLLAADLFNAIGLAPSTLSFLMSNLVFFVLISYSQFFYIVLWRSIEYRNAFIDSWVWLPCCKKLRSSMDMKSTRISGTVHSTDMM